MTGPIARVTCPKCGRLFARRRDGMPYVHGCDLAQEISMTNDPETPDLPRRDPTPTPPPKPKPRKPERADPEPEIEPDDEPAPTRPPTPRPDERRAPEGPTPALGRRRRLTE